MLVLLSPCEKILFLHEMCLLLRQRRDRQHPNFVENRIRIIYAIMQGKGPSVILSCIRKHFLSC